MAIVVPSRFSLLKIVEDDFLPPKPKENNKTKKVEQKNKKVDDKKVKNAKTKQNNKNGIKKKTTPPANVEQQENTPKFVDPSDVKFEEDLQQALHLSKLETEKEMLGNVEINNTPYQCINKKQKKKSSNAPDLWSSSNEDFDKNSNDKNSYLEEKKSKRNMKNEFLDSNRNDCSSKREPPSNEEIKGSQLQVILDNKDKEITNLKIEISSLKDELLRVKSRNKQLCNIIGQGEMQDKAEVLAEVERLREISNELTNEVEVLHMQLEQERSKGSTSKIDTKFKDKKNMKEKRVRFNCSNE